MGLFGSRGINLSFGYRFFTFCCCIIMMSNQQLRPVIPRNLYYARIDHDITNSPSLILKLKESITRSLLSLYSVKSKQKLFASFEFLMFRHFISYKSPSDNSVYNYLDTLSPLTILSHKPFLKYLPLSSSSQTQSYSEELELTKS